FVSAEATRASLRACALVESVHTRFPASVSSILTPRRSSGRGHGGSGRPPRGGRGGSSSRPSRPPGGWKARRANRIRRGSATRAPSYVQDKLEVLRGGRPPRRGRRVARPN